MFSQSDIYNIVETTRRYRQMSHSKKPSRNIAQPLLLTENGAIRATISGGSENRETHICECAFNILRGTVPLTVEQKNHLRKHVTQLRALTRKGNKIERKKQIIQRGGGCFLPTFLIPIVTTLLGQVLN